MVIALLPIPPPLYLLFGPNATDTCTRSCPCRHLNGAVRYAGDVRCVAVPPPRCRYGSWEEYVMEAVIKPLGMSDTGNPSDYLAGTGARARLVDGVNPPDPAPVTVAMEVSEPAENSPPGC